MAVVSEVVPVPVERVWDVLADGWSYGAWVVGASHVRKVDPGWPAVGAGIHHSVGAWPLVIKDVTRVRDLRVGEMLELDARLWPFGAATVRIELTAVARGTEVVMVERARTGPAAVLPAAVQDAMLKPRNVETLGRLRALATRRTD
jgi:hypothetical protein